MNVVRRTMVFVSIGLFFGGSIGSAVYTNSNYYVGCNDDYWVDIVYPNSGFIADEIYIQWNYNILQDCHYHFFKLYCIGDREYTLSEQYEQTHFEWNSNSVPDGYYRIKVELWVYYYGEDNPTFVAEDYSDSSFVIDNAFDADFSWEANGLTVTFTDMSTSFGDITYWGWDFNRDGKFDDYGEIVTYTFPDAGSYKVGLVVQNEFLQTKSTSKFVTVRNKIPNLDCSGSLSWSNSKPDELVVGSFNVKNSGETDSKLDWSIKSYPDWGTWTFTPSKGEDLKPSHGFFTVEVSVRAPDVEDQSFTGEVLVANDQDAADVESIPVSLTTPKNKDTDHPLLRFFDSSSLLFSFVQRMLKIR